MAAAAVLALAACGGGGGATDDLERLSRALFQAVKSGDEAAFVDLHVREGDMSPDGGFWICTRAGGVRPDAAWTEEVRGFYAQSRERFEALEREHGAGSYVGPAKGARTETHVGEITFAVTFGTRTLTGRIGAAMVAKRGLVIVGQPGGLELK